MKYTISLITILLTCSCSCSLLKDTFLVKGRAEINIPNYSYYTSKDLIEHLSSLGESYLNSPGVKILDLQKENEDYLLSIFDNFLFNNELLINAERSPKFYVIKNEIPFHFSLPQGKIFLSLGLLQKYVRSEGDLVAILFFEFIKSYRSLYTQNVIVPLGFISTERIISLTRISLNNKLKINKWVFYSLKRSGHDPYFILNWLQQQNRNSLDFFLHLGDTKSIAKEEFLVKSFIIHSKFSNNKMSKFRKNSSKNFYRFIYDVKMEKI